MNFITNKTVVRAVGFSIAVAAFLYVLITQQDSKIKDQLILDQTHKINELSSQVAAYKAASDSARNTVDSKLNISIENQHILLDLFKLQNNKYAALLAYLHSINVMIPSNFNSTFTTQLNSHSATKSKKSKSKGKCKTCQTQIQQKSLLPIPLNLPPNLNQLPIQIPLALLTLKP